MVRRVWIEVALVVVLVITAVFLAKAVFQKDMPRPDGGAATTRPSQDDLAKQRLRSLGYLN